MKGHGGMAALFIFPKMGCTASKSIISIVPESKPVEPSPLVVNKAPEVLIEDKIAVVVAAPVIRTVSPINEIHTQAKQKVLLQKQKEHFEARNPNPHLSEPKQPKIKTSLHFEQIGAAQLDLEGLEVKETQPSKSSVKKKDTRERLLDDVEALLADELN